MLTHTEVSEDVQHENYNRKHKENYIFKFMSSTVFDEAIWLLYLASRGMSLVQIGILESIFHITSMLCEVPTGYIADRYGRKTSRDHGAGAAFIGCVIMISSHSFAFFAIGIIFSSLSYNLNPVPAMPWSMIP